MRAQSIGAHAEVSRLLATAPASSVRLFQQAALEILTLPVQTDVDSDDARAQVHRVLARVESPLRHELEAAFSAACGAAARAVARAWLADLGWASQTDALSP
jgi:hypothetical protein